MKKKPILTIVMALAVLIACFAFTRDTNLPDPEKRAIISFLNSFNKQLKAGNIDSVASYFTASELGYGMEFLARVTSEYHGSPRKVIPPFEVTLGIKKARIKSLGSGLFAATVMASCSTTGAATKTSAIIFTIQKKAANLYKITGMDVRDFNNDYRDFSLMVSNKKMPDKFLYKPVTLDAFKVAEKLKKRYAGVVWFSHINGKTFYYVYKGTLPNNTYLEDNMQRSWANIKMGLVSPDLKEIIPAAYDVVHNISGPINGLVEVEKDNKKGLYNLNGKMIARVEYDEIIPLSNKNNIALLVKGDKNYYLKNDFTVTSELDNFNIAEHLPDLAIYGKTFMLQAKNPTEVMEANSRQMDNAIYIAPSYLADLKIAPNFMMQVNPLRKMTARPSADLTGTSIVKFNKVKIKPAQSWYERIFYTVKEHYLGGRSGFYESKNVILADKKSKRLLGFSAAALVGEPWMGRGPTLSGRCNENDLRALNDSVFEFKTTSTFYTMLAAHGHYLAEGPYYHYMQVKNGNLVPLPSRRQFPTQFVKLDNTYLQGCYLLTDSEYDDAKKGIIIDAANAEILEYMKNEIYASYHYHFKDKEWNTIFASRFNNDDISIEKRDNIQDSLTTIDKYNIDFIESKLKILASNKLAAK